MGMIDDLDVAARLHRLPVWRNADRETRQGLLRSETHQANIDAMRGMPATYETKADFIGCSVRTAKTISNVSRYCIHEICEAAEHQEISFSDAEHTACLPADLQYLLLCIRRTGIENSDGKPIKTLAAAMKHLGLPKGCQLEHLTDEQKTEIKKRIEQLPELERERRI